MRWPFTTNLQIFKTEFVIDCVSDLLLTAEILLGGLDGNMTEKELDLLQLSSSHMAELGARTPKIMRRKPVDTGALGRSLHNVPNCFCREPFGPNLIGVSHIPEQVAGTDLCCRGPVVYG